MQDELEDKDLKIEELEAKMNLLDQDNKNYQRIKEVMQMKINHIYDSNILIPKEGGDDSGANQADK